MTFIVRILTVYHSVISFFKRKVFISSIKHQDVVLDVGSGDKPFWRADVIVDKFREDNQQRHSGEIIYDKNKIFIEADVEKLPFKDKVFDFVFCSHLLEHVQNPDKAILELVRVAKRGYIEVPNGIYDILKPFPPHLWYCDYRDNTLLFMQKEKNKNFLLENTEAFGKQFFDHPLFQYLLAKYQDKVFIELYWEKKIPFRVYRSKNPYRYIYKKNVGQGKDTSTRVGFLFYKIFFFTITMFLYKRKKINVESLLK